MVFRRPSYCTSGEVSLDAGCAGCRAVRRSAAPTSQQQIVQGHSTGVDLSPFLYHVVGCVVFTDPHRQILVYVAYDMRGLGVLIMMT